MEKITFVNDSEPYLSAENLNQLQENIEQATVKASSTEPTNENVWFKRGKNLLNKNDVVIGYYIPQGSTSETLTASATALTSGWIPCKPNTQYVISGHNKGRWQTKAQDGTITLLSEGANKITTNATAKYMRVYFYGNYAGTIPNVQIEQGSTITPYEEYIEKEIYVKNDNGVFEEFYNETNNKTNLVYSEVLTQLKTEVVINNLDINRDGCYELIIASSGTSNEVSIYANNDLTDTNYKSQRIYAKGTTISGESKSAPVSGYVYDDGGLIIMNISFTPNGKMVTTSQSTLVSTSSGVEMLYYSMSNLVGKENITSLTIKGSNGFSASTKIYLYRK